MNKKYMYATSAALLVLVFGGGIDSARAVVTYATCTANNSGCKLSCPKVPLLGITSAQKAKKEQVKLDRQECLTHCDDTLKACRASISAGHLNAAGGGTTGTSTVPTTSKTPTTPTTPTDLED